MATINYGTKELTCKIVYVGPGFGGKTTNLQKIHEKAPAETTGVLTSLATSEDRTLFFDLLPMDFGKIGDFRVKIQLYTVPGQVKYNATRRMVLKGADGIVVVFDSDPAREDANYMSLANLHENLAAHGLSPQEVPTVFQFNKRDLATAMDIRYMSRSLNPDGLVPEIESIATEGVGVMETIRKICSLVFERIQREVPSKSRAGTGPRRTAAVARERSARAPAVSTSQRLDLEALGEDAGRAGAGRPLRVKQVGDLRLGPLRVGHALVDLALGEGEAEARAQIELRPILGQTRIESLRFTRQDDGREEGADRFESSENWGRRPVRLTLIRRQEGRARIFLQWRSGLGEMAIAPEDAGRPDREPAMAGPERRTGG